MRCYARSMICSVFGDMLGYVMLCYVVVYRVTLCDVTLHWATICHVMCFEVWLRSTGFGLLGFRV